MFTPATGRILDTAKGTGGFSTPMEAGKYRTIKVAGLAGVPDDGSVGAVSLNATVGTAPGYGTLFGRPDADTSRTSMLIYNGNTGEYVSNTATVAVGADGTIQIMAETSARVILDVQGYYTANTNGTAAGGFVPVAGKRFVDTRSGLGAPKATIAPGKSVDVQVAGTNGVPADASGAVVNLIAINSTSSDGNLTPYATGSAKPQNSLHYTPSTTTSIQAQVGLSTDGKMTIANASSTVNLVIDLQGYFTAAGQTGASFTPGTGRAYDSRATGNTILAKNETRSIQIAGAAGVPVMGSGITAVVLTLVVAHGGSDGRAAVWADGAAKPDTTAINFQTDEIRTNTVTVPLGANGRISLNNIADATNYVIDVQGWYIDPRSPSIDCGTYTPGSWTAVTPDSVTCSVTAAPAASSGQQLIVDGGDVESEPVQLSETRATNSKLSFVPSGGPNDITATVVDQSGEAVTQKSVSLGFGDWSASELSTFPADGRHVAGDILLAISPSGNTAFGNEIQTTFSIASDPEMSAVVWTNTVQDSETPVPEGLLTDGQNYYWQATVVSQKAWDGPAATKDSPVSTITADSNAIAVEPDDVSSDEDRMQLRAGPIVAHWTSLAVTDKKLLDNRYTNWSDIIGGCKAPRGTKCTATMEGTAKVEVQTAFGITRGAVSGSLGITKSTTVTYGTKSTSRAFEKDGMLYTCAPMGKRFKYKVQQTQHYSLFGSTSSKSGWKYAFEPIRNLFECRFEK
ncbi:hypothetical protein DEJ01_09780 [Curtobacterium sp. MCLR17_040]|nr:hypothetical protein DEJ01_09780 [Curtobacterium sp. MCLR17_040]